MRTSYSFAKSRIISSKAVLVQQRRERRLGVRWRSTRAADNKNDLDSPATACGSERGNKQCRLPPPPQWDLFPSAAAQVAQRSALQSSSSARKSRHVPENQVGVEGVRLRKAIDSGFQRPRKRHHSDMGMQVAG
ncbi:hypothetical protein J6590_105144, partial [Homalodisca vitripennis]